jgi:cation diffusion facilitator CzcD-associated flavoprotein CzcO
LSAPSRATATAEDVSSAWLADLARSLGQANATTIEQLFLADAWWRDLLAFTWDLRSFHGPPAIALALLSSFESTAPSAFRVTKTREPDLPIFDGLDMVVAFFDFETAIARGNGVLRLKATDSGWKAWTLLTNMDELKGFEEMTGSRRPLGNEHGALSWPKRRVAQREAADHDPAVLVIGAGQNGLAIAARLRQLDVTTLVVEKNERVGDNWRHRYDSLVLHDPVWFDHLPYLSFPPQWPVFTPKDKLADWLESYSRIMELDIWTQAHVQEGHYDAEGRRWSVQIRDASGTERTMHPRHVVLATGLYSVPFVPEIAGAADFGGTFMHSSLYRSGREFAGKKAVVIGASNSGHDIAQDLYEHGVNVTMIQRSSTYVINSADFVGVLLAGRYEEGGPPTADADRLSISVPNRMLLELARYATQVVAGIESELLSDLDRRGFEVGFGDAGAGITELFLQRGGGYYINVGAAELIATGKIKVKHSGVQALTHHGLVCDDGTYLPADLVVLATGYHNMRESARRLFGNEVADRCTTVWGLDDEGELRAVWRKSGQDGLWFMAGNLQQARIFSKFLALQIKAIEEGVVGVGPGS